ncbi:MAG: LuxR C-terminal-related transcriptional regulator [Nakamurella sp.]
MTVAQQQLPVLTPRQEQILELIGEGMTNREIGVRLGVAEKTIKNSVTGLLASLNVQRRSQAAVYSVLRRVPGGLSAANQLPTSQPSVAPPAPPLRPARS